MLILDSSLFLSCTSLLYITRDVENVLASSLFAFFAFRFRISFVVSFFFSSRDESSKVVTILHDMIIMVDFYVRFLDC